MKEGKIRRGRKTKLGTAKASRLRRYRSSRGYHPVLVRDTTPSARESIASLNTGILGVEKDNVAEAPQSVYPESSCVLELAERATKQVMSHEKRLDLAQREKAAELVKEK